MFIFKNCSYSKVVQIQKLSKLKIYSDSKNVQIYKSVQISKNVQKRKLFKIENCSNKKTDLKNVNTLKKYSAL